MTWGSRSLRAVWTGRLDDTGIRLRGVYKILSEFRKYLVRQVGGEWQLPFLEKQAFHDLLRYNEADAKYWFVKLEGDTRESIYKVESQILTFSFGNQLNNIWMSGLNVCVRRKGAKSPGS